MTVVSSTDFATNQDKYLELALNEQVFIKKGNNVFIITTANGYDDDDDDELLALAKERRAGVNREFASVDEFINFLEK